MPYSESELEEMERDPVRLKGYFWRVATNAHRMALQNYALSRVAAQTRPVNNYKPVFDEGYELIRDAKHLEMFSQAILENIDALVQSSLKT